VTNWKDSSPKMANNVLMGTLNRLTHTHSLRPVLGTRWTPVCPRSATQAPAAGRHGPSGLRGRTSGPRSWSLELVGRGRGTKRLHCTQRRRRRRRS